MPGSKPQYEAQFKRWGFRKKLTRDTWHNIGHILDRRKEQGQKSHVYVFGERLANEKVKKDTTRYRLCATNARDCEISTLPEGVVIRESSVQVDELSPPQTSYDFSSSTDTSTETNTPDDLYRSEPTSYSPMVLPLSPFPSALILIPSRWPSPTHGTDIEIFERPSIPEIGYLWDVLPHSDAEMLPCNTLTLFEGLQNPLLAKFARICGIKRDEVDPCVGRAMSLLPFRAQHDLDTKSFEFVLFRQIMFLLMNNFAGSDYGPFESLFHRLREFSISQLEDILDNIPYPYSTALQQSILTIAIKSDVPAIVRILLDRGLDMGQVTCRFAGTSYTPLGLACNFRRMEIIQILVDHGVDVNQKDRHTLDTAMWNLLGFDMADASTKEELPSITRDILRLLLMAGARIEWRELENTRFWTNKSLLEVFVRHSKHPVRFDYTYQLHRPLINATQLVEDSKATQAVKVMLGRDFKAGVQPFSTLETPCMDALQGASLQGNVELVKYFLNCGFRPTVKCLSLAVRGNSSAVIQCFLEAGIELDLVLAPNHDLPELLRPYAGTLMEDVDELLHEGILIRYGLTTPFAEAIRWRRHTLVQMFEACNILENITEPSRLTAALIAAAEAGNIAMVKMLLERAYNSLDCFVPALASALSLATLGRHVEIVELLMEAGIKPNRASLMSAVVVHDAKLLRLFFDTGSSVDIPGLLWFAVRWGHIGVIQDLLRAGVAINEFGWHLGFMETNMHLHDVVRSPLGEAIHRGDSRITQLLLEEGANVSMELRTDRSGHKGLSPLAVAVQSDNLTLVASLLKLGADPNDPVALLASTTKNVAVTRALVDAFTKRYPEGKKYFASKALRRAIRDNNEPLVAMLVRYTDPNDLEQRREEQEEVESQLGRSLEYLPSPLGEAIIGTNKHIIELLLCNHGNPHATVATQVPSPHTGRWTAILQAVATGDLLIVEVLRSAGAKINCIPELGITRTPLQLAIDMGHYEIVRYLLEQGADVNAPPCIWGGGTALQLAAIKGHVGIAEMLIDRGADVNAARSKYQGRTAFEGAAEHGRMDMLLLLYHKHVDIVSDGGEQIRRAMDLAVKNGQMAAKSLVEQLAEAAKVDAIVAF